MPSITAYARACYYGDKSISSPSNMIDGNDSTYATINCDKRDENIDIFLYGFDFSAIPSNAHISHASGVAPIICTIVGCPGVGNTVKTQIYEITVYNNGTKTVYWNYSSSPPVLINSTASLQHQSYSYNGAHIGNDGYSQRLVDAVRSTDGLNNRGRNGSVPDNYTGFVVKLKLSNLGAVSSKSYIYSFKVKIDYDIVTDPPIYVGKTRAKVYIGNNLVSGIYIGNKKLL